LGNFIQKVTSFVDGVRDLYLGGSKWIPMFVQQVFLDIEEGIEKEGRHPASFQVSQENLVLLFRMNHIEHLKKKSKTKF
jgi:hypothetical protein